MFPRIDLPAAAASDPPRLSVIIPHRGPPEAIRDCLAALSRLTERPDEVVVANNGDPDDGPAIAALAAGEGLEIKVIHAAQPGAGPARNAGVHAASGDWLAFIDSDCLTQADWTTAARHSLAAAPIAGGRIVIVPAVVGRPTPIEAFDLEFGLDAELFLRRGGHLVTPNLLCSRAAFIAVGPFRAGVPEDKEWSYRAVAAGYTLRIAHDAVVVHPALATWPQLAYRWRRMTREEHILARERRFGMLRFWLRSWLVLASIGPHAVRILRSAKLIGASRPRVILVMARCRIDRFRLAQQLVLGGST